MNNGRKKDFDEARRHFSEISEDESKSYFKLATKALAQIAEIESKKAATALN